MKRIEVSSSIIFISFVVILLCFQNCSKQNLDNTNSNEISNQVRRDKMAAIEKEVFINVNSHQTCDMDSDCLALPFGVKACGGPASYLILSVLGGMPADKLLDLKSQVATYNQLSDEQNKAEGWVSDCSVLFYPNLVCQKNACLNTIQPTMNPFAFSGPHEQLGFD